MPGTGHGHSSISSILSSPHGKRAAASSSGSPDSKRPKTENLDLGGFDTNPANLEMSNPAGDKQAKAEEIKAEGNAKLAAKDYASAEQLYSQAIDICPDIEAYYTNRALARANLRKFDLASEDCMAALRINPKSARAYGRLGSAMFQAEKFRDSRDAYLKALELDAENATYKQGLAAAEAKLKPVVTSSVEDTVGAIDKILSSAMSSNGAVPAVSVNNTNADMGIGLGRSMRAKQVCYISAQFAPLSRCE
jgi:tetratricopeptide (TPR) repeat protein